MFSSNSLVMSFCWLVFVMLSLILLHQPLRVLVRLVHKYKSFNAVVIFLLCRCIFLVHLSIVLSLSVHFCSLLLSDFMNLAPHFSCFIRNPPLTFHLVDLSPHFSQHSFCFIRNPPLTFYFPLLPSNCLIFSSILLTSAPNHLHSFPVTSFQTSYHIFSQVR